MKVFLTGGSGFIGQYLESVLKENNFEQIKIQEEIDVRNSESVKKIKKLKPDIIIHLAAKSTTKNSEVTPIEFLQTNTLGTLNVLNFIKENSNIRLLNLSSSAVYRGSNKLQLISENSEIQPRNPYGISKFASEKLCDYFAETFNLPILNIRPFLITGNGKKTDILNEWATQLQMNIEKNLKEFYVGDLDQYRDFLHVSDFAAGIITLLKANMADGCINICSGNSVNLSELLSLVKSKNQYFQRGDVRIISRQNPFRTREPKYLVGNPELLIKMGWKPRLDIEQIVTEIFENN
jgi:GDP-4-dehydro-6-deoxy-D-mannose reductase